MTIKLLLADDDEIIREGLKMIIGIDNNFEIVACVENGLLAFEFCKNNSVDVALLDVRMPVMNGVEASKRISSETKTKPLILTTFDDDEFITEAIKHGAKGYLLKNNPPEKIKEAIKVVHGGSIIMQDVVMDKIKEALGVKKQSKINADLFSDREMEIMALISRGYSNKDISKELFISEGTVANYITSLFNKTGLEHRTQIAIYYLNGGEYEFLHT
jgi:DNA-binding NarL/FixJ family response regulator